MTDSPANVTGTILDECPIMPMNNFVVIKTVHKQKGLLITPDTILENSGIVVGCGGNVSNGELLLGKHILYAKFRHAEPYTFIKDGKRQDYFILMDCDIIGPFVDQSQVVVK